MNTVKWVTGIIGILLFAMSSYLKVTFGWGDWVLILSSVCLTICVALIIVGIFVKKK